MKININEPIDHKWTPEDVVEDYRKYQDKKKVAKIYGITAKEVAQIIKEIYIFQIILKTISVIFKLIQRKQK